VIDYHTIAHSVVASLLAAAARAVGFVVGGAAILLMMTLWLAVLWCCRLFDRDPRADRHAPLAG
jgi:hypothetical protein